MIRRQIYKRIEKTTYDRAANFWEAELISSLSSSPLTHIPGSLSLSDKGITCLIFLPIHRGGKTCRDWSTNCVFQTRAFSLVKANGQLPGRRRRQDEMNLGAGLIFLTVGCYSRERCHCTAQLRLAPASLHTVTELCCISRNPNHKKFAEH